MIMDIFYGILCPGVVFYGAPTIRRKFTKLSSEILTKVEIYPAFSLVNRTFPCMEANYPYDNEEQEIPLVWGIFATSWFFMA